jgi:hypothetical protein
MRGISWIRDVSLLLLHDWNSLIKKALTLSDKVKQALTKLKSDAPSAQTP